VEVLMALLVMTVGLLGLLQAVIVALEYDTKSLLREESVHLAEESMNDFRLAASHADETGFRNAAFNDATKENATVQVTVPIRGGNRTFTVYRDYQQVFSSARRLRVKVTWNYRGSEWQHEIFTVKSSR